MDWGFVFDIVITALFGGIIAHGLFWMTRIARHQRARDGWFDDLGWIFFSVVISGAFIAGVWTDNGIVPLLTIGIVFATNSSRHAAAQRSIAAHKQHLTDKALAAAAADSETAEPDETRHEQETR